MTKKKNDIIKTIAIILAVTQMLILLFLLGFERRSSFDYPNNMPPDFNFIAGNDFYKIDTYNNTLTKLIEMGKDTIINYKFPPMEKEKIFKKLKQIDIYKYPENYAPTSTVQILPANEYYISLTINGENLKIDWIENTYSETKDAQNLSGLFDAIFKIINEDKKVRNLPESKIHRL
jgi:hypothetical protein